MDLTHRIELTRHRTTPALAGLVAGVVGLTERAPGPVERRQPAGSMLPLVVSFGAPLRVVALSEGVGAARSYGSFVAGFSTGHADTRFERTQDSVQVYLTPLGVRAVLHTPGSELAHRVTAVEDVVPVFGSVAERLAGLPTWAQRFAHIERMLVARAAQGPLVPGWVTWMWRQLRVTGGQARIGELVAATGWSHRHVTSTFSREIGLSPKQAAAVVRFERAAMDLGRLPLAGVAARHGYADQSHLARAVARYAGESPTALAAAQRPTPSSALGMTSEPGTAPSAEAPRWP